MSTTTTPAAQPSAPAAQLVPVRSIRFTRAEGRSDGLDGTGQEKTFSTFAAVNAYIFQLRARLPADTLGYYKCDFTIEWENGDTYTGRYDLGHDTDDRTLDGHVRSHCEFSAGRSRPSRMTAERHAAYLKNYVGEEKQREYARLLDTLQIGDPS